MSSEKKKTGSKGIDGTTTKYKGESQQSHQQGAPSVSKKNTPKHTKDHSGSGPEHNTSKKGANSI